MTSPFPAMPESEKELVDKAFAAFDGANLNDTWIVAITLLARVLLNQDEFTQTRTLAGLTSELRAAMHGIREIQTKGHNPVSLQ